MVDLLRERLAESYEFILQLETIAAAAPSTGAKSDSTEKAQNGARGFRLEKKIPCKVNPSCLKGTLPESSLIEAFGLFPKETMTALLAALPRLDHSIRLLFDTLVVSTVLLFFIASLLENSILLVSSYRSVLMKVPESLHALMHPLSWPHVCISILMPNSFHFGAKKQALEDAQRQLSEEGGDDLFAGAGEELLIVDLDKGVILRGEVPCVLPDSVRFDLRDSLYECLKPNVSRSDHVFAHHFPSKPLVFQEFAVRGLFFRAVNKLIGDFGYHRYVWTDEFERKRTFLLTKTATLQRHHLSALRRVTSRGRMHCISLLADGIGPCGSGRGLRREWLLNVL
ncbi:hypothetical protein PsorP6_019387 [Peronosclerospora sorghi]|nr:hypothetical protein PsorP6_019387 [Peronosclerospora sorghi]